jgi:NAD(P)-dependent dehydrogenase (short-subunit alcohol dehydrogenase family)
MSQLLKNKRALITGASKGIGAAVVLAFAREGADLILCSRSLPDLEEIASQARAFGVRVITLPADLSDAAQTDKLGDDALAAFGGLDIFVSNAFYAEAGLATFLEIDGATWDKTQSTNLGASVRLLRKFGPHFLTQKSGNVIIMSSIRGLNGVPMGAAYATTKAALNSLTRTLACEWGAAGVRVNAILPGPVLTEAVRNALNNDAASIEYFGNIKPLKGWIMPEHIAEPAVFLASDAARYVSGHLLVVDGALTALSQDAFASMPAVEERALGA